MAFPHRLAYFHAASDVVSSLSYSFWSSAPWTGWSWLVGAVAETWTYWSISHGEYAANGWSGCRLVVMMVDTWRVSPNFGHKPADAKEAYDQGKDWQAPQGEIDIPSLTVRIWKFRQQILCKIYSHIFVPVIRSLQKKSLFWCNCCS